VLENALEVVVHEGAFKEHLAMLEAARKTASQETAALRAEAEELREKVKSYDENNAILRHHVTAKRREVGALQQQLVEQTQVRHNVYMKLVRDLSCSCNTWHSHTQLP
jgi:hypothetical protein